MAMAGVGDCGVGQGLTSGAYAEADVILAGAKPVALAALGCRACLRNDTQMQDST